MGINIEIDHLTPCLLDNATGELVDTEYLKASASDIEKIRAGGWLFDWTAPDLHNAEIYILCVQGEDEIQGLVAITVEQRNLAVHLQLAESAPHNKGKNKKYDGVGGHLFAIAVQISLENGFGGFIYFEAKNMELVKHYQDAFGAFWCGMPHEYSMLIDEDAAKNLLDEYTLIRGGD